MIFHIINYKKEIPFCQELRSWMEKSLSVADQPPYFRQGLSDPVILIFQGQHPPAMGAIFAGAGLKRNPGTA
jgi:hypothetical protein